jgi:hypothetical protein
MRPEGHTGDDRGAGGDEADCDVDALAAVGRPVDVVEVQQQSQLVDDQSVRRTECDRGRGWRRCFSVPRRPTAATVASNAIPML